MEIHKTFTGCTLQWCDNLHDVCTGCLRKASVVEDFFLLIALISNVFFFIQNLVTIQWNFMVLNSNNKFDNDTWKFVTLVSDKQELLTFDFCLFVCLI